MNHGTGRYLVSAIVSTYKAERFLRGKLEDLEAQTIADRLEIIVIDSGSPQDERSIVEEFQRRYDNIRYLRTEKRETVYQAWNRGARLATGEFLANANTDDRLRRDALEVLARTLQEHPECVLAYPDFRITQEENATFESHRSYGFKDWPPYDRLSLLELCCVGPFPLWRRSLHAEVGYFDERYRCIADYEFWLRAAERHQFIHVPQFLGLYWLSEQTVSRRGDLPTLEYLQIQKEYRARFAHLAPPPAALPPRELERLGEIAAAARAGGDAALADLKRFVETHPDCAAAHHELATLYYRREEIGLARKYFEKAALLEPGSKLFSDALAGFLRMELYRSLQDHTAQAASGPEPVEDLLCAGMICILLERYEAARQNYLRALEIEPHNTIAAENLAALETARKPADPPEVARAPERPSAPAVPEAAVTLLVTSGGGPDRVRRCLENIERNTPQPHEVVVIDRGTCSATLAWLQKRRADQGNLRFIEAGSEAGVPAAWNAAVRQSSGRLVALLSSDLMLTPGWLTGLVNCLEREPGAALCGPMIAGGSGPQGITGVDTENQPRLELFARGFAEAHAGRRLPADRLSPCCLLATRELLERSGEFDPALKSGEFALRDLCLRAALAGLRSSIAGEVLVGQLPSPSSSEQGDAALAVAAGKAFEEKWELTRLEESLAKQLLTRKALVLGSTLARRGRLNEAVDLLLQQGIQFSPASPEPYRRLAEILMDIANWQDAFEVLGEMPEGDAEAKGLLSATCLAALGRLEEARELVSGLPGSAAALELAGSLAARRGETAQAEQLFRAAFGADPGFGPACTELARCAWERGARREALHLAEHGFLLAPLSMTALARFDEYAVACQALPVEEARVREARAIYPEHRGLAFGLIDLLIRDGRYPEALQEIGSAARDFGVDDDMLDAALKIRELAGPPPAAAAGTGSLSVCLIVKDEARHLPAALASVRSLADEIVVVDTGSSDRSADIARLFGARLFSFPWNGDFSQARNASLAAAQGDWILVLDADEVLAEKDLPVLGALLRQGGAPVAYSVITRNYTEEITRRNWTANSGEYPQEEQGSGWTPSAKVRLFPNDRRVRFAGAVHELLEPSLAACGIAIRECPVPVHHYGKLDLEKCAEKQQHYYQLGLKKLAETGGDLESLTELAIQATELKRYQEAEELWYRLLAVQPEHAEAHFNLGYLLLSTGNYGKARSHALRGAQLAPGMKEAAFNLAKCELFLGNAERAHAGCRDMLSQWADYPPALSLLCVTNLILGQTEEAERLLERLRCMRFDCVDFLLEYAGGLRAGARGDLAFPLEQLASRISPAPPGAHAHG